MNRFFGFGLLALISLSLAAPAGSQVPVTRTTTLVTSGAVTSTGPAVDTGFVAVPSGARAMNVRIVAANNSGSTPTLDVVAYYCYSRSNASCKVLYTFDQCTTGSCWTDGFKVYHVEDGTHPGPYIQIRYTLGGGSPNYTLAAYLDWGI